MYAGSMPPTAPSHIAPISPQRPIQACAQLLALALALQPALASRPTPAPPATPQLPVAVIDGKDSPVPAIPMGDPATIARVIDLARTDSRVIQHHTHLAQTIGPRLTGSTSGEQANQWAADQLRAWGLANVSVAPWGTIATRFDRGPSTLKLLSAVERKRDDGDTTTERNTLRELQFTTLAWTRGTDGPARGRIVRMPTTTEEYDALRDQLKGAWVLVKSAPPAGRRGVQERMTQTFTAKLDARVDVAANSKRAEDLPIAQRIIFDGILGTISASRDEYVRTTAATGWRSRAESDIPPDVQLVVRRSDYDAINSRLADAESIELEADLQHTLSPGPIPVSNVFAEIVGTQWPEQVVIISGHIDSWDGPGSQGAVDNGTGVAVTIEAARLLMAAGAKPKRTIRFALWTGEEQGLLGSRAYIDQNKETLVTNVSACFVDDGGTDTQGGLQCLPTQVELLAAATAPANYVFYSTTDAKWLNVNVRAGNQGGGSDHASFNQVGIPGFFWDEVGRADYGHGWHTQHDRQDLAIEEYLRQSALVSAITAYNLACAPEMLPRKPPTSAPTPTAAPTPTPTPTPTLDAQP